MQPSSRTPEGEPNLCPLCGDEVVMEPSAGFRDAPCPHCGHLIRFLLDGQEAISAQRKRQLDQCFEHGSKSFAQGNFDYATVMFTQCVRGDPGNPEFAKAFLENLFRKYGNNKKGSKMASMQGVGAKGKIKRALMSNEWIDLIGSGLDMLKLNPWDVPTLEAMATACRQLDFAECQSIYLKTAQGANP